MYITISGYCFEGDDASTMRYWPSKAKAEAWIASPGRFPSGDYVKLLKRKPDSTFELLRRY